MRDMPWPTGTSEAFIAAMNYFYSTSQIFATVACLMVNMEGVARVGGGGGLAQGLGVGLVAAPTGLSPLCPGLVSWRSTKAAALAHRFCFSVGGGSWHQHI